MRGSGVAGSREAQDQPGGAHHGHRPATQPDRKARLYDRRKSEGKTSMEALRALKRRLSNIVYKTTLDDAITHAAASSRTSPGGQRETTLTPARPALIPTPTLRTSHFPDPPRPSLE